MSNVLALSDFSSVVGSSFHVRTNSDVSLQLELLEAVKLSEVSTNRSESFSLLFRGPTDKMLPQQICPLSHSTLGELGIFLVPVARETDGIRYEAVFN